MSRISNSLPRVPNEGDWRGLRDFLNRVRVALEGITDTGGAVAPGVYVTPAVFSATLASYATTAALAAAIAALSGVYAPAAHTHDASDIVSGVIDTDRLGSGSATSSTYLRGDQTWQTVPIVGSLDDLSDVDTTGVADGNALVYDAMDSTWKPGVATGGGGSGNLDGGSSSSIYGGTTPVDGGDST